MTYIIAEAGTGHFAPTVEGRVATAAAFIGAARAAGADACKFQMFTAGEPLFCPVDGDERRRARWDQTVIPLDKWRHLQQVATYLGIDLMWSVFQPTCIGWLKELKPRYVKVASRARTTHPLDWPSSMVLISGPPDERDWIGGMRLKCVAKYPAPLAECGYDAGFAGLSDHSGTIWPGLDAIYHEAPFLEVHFKIEPANMGNDEPVCLTIEQLRTLCAARNAVKVMRHVA